MNWKPEDIQFAVWSLREAEYFRSKKRALIASLFDGTPPYSQREVEENNIAVNVNDLSGTREAHNARAQFSAAFMKPGAFFSARTDAGEKHKREGYGRTATKHAAKIMKRSLPYFETLRSKFAMVVLHGISPCVFPDAARWNPRPIAIEDVLVPGDTELIMDDLPFFAVYRRLTGKQLIKMAKGPKPDPGWNQSLVNACLKWIDEQTIRLAGDSWGDYWKPEFFEQRIKEGGVAYANDIAATVNVYDFYYWNDDKKVSGWNRKMVLDPWTMPDPGGIRTKLTGGPYSEKNQCLYDPGTRKWADSREQIINWQFADLSAVAPFRYHSVRSLGFLLYSVCHLQNRLRCSFNAAVFEQLMILMRIKTMDDMQRALSVNLVNRGFVDDSVDFIPASERYQVNAQLAQMGLMENANLIARNSSSYTAKQGGTQDNRVPTATQWMGEEQKLTQLVSAGLMQAYEYQRPEYREIFRRFLRKNSTDPDVREFQKNCLKDGVPEDVLYNLAAWDIEPERVFGAGNKTLEVAVAQWLMENRMNFDPQAQRRILHDATLAITDDAARADALVPDEPVVSSSVHDAQLAIGTLLVGQPMELRQNVSHAEYAQALLDALGVSIAKINAIGGVPESAAELLGLQNLAGVTIEGQPVPGNGAANHIAIVAQDPKNKARAKNLGDQLGKAMNEVKAFAQRLQEMQQSQNGGNGQMDETQGKIVAMQIQAEAKAANTRESHAQRTAQRSVQFELEQQRKNQQTQAEIERANARFNQELQQEAIQTLADIEIEKAKAQAARPRPKPNKSGAES